MRNRQTDAVTLIEVLVVILILAVFVSMLLPAGGGKSKAQRISCVYNLKQIGVAYNEWSDDNTNNFPAEVMIRNGGWKDILSKQNQGEKCWINYVIMKNEFHLSPKMLVCPADDRYPTTNFANINNSNISYFVGVGAGASHPRSILGGDRNLARGLQPYNTYGFSPADGTGNDVAIQTNSITDPVSWSLKMHSSRNSAGAGNILLGDASVQQVTSKRFRTDYQPFALDSGNWPSNHIPTTPSFRLIFP